LINRRLALLFAAAGGLAAYGVWSDGGSLLQRLTGDSPVVSDASPVAATGSRETGSIGDGAKSLNPMSNIALESLSEMVARPLFNPTRAPAPKVQQAAPVVVPEAPFVEETINPGDFTLLAVASNKEGRTAVVRRNTTSEVFHLKLGQFLSDWQVLELGDRDMTLGRQDQSFQLKLFQARVGAAAQPPAEINATNQPAAEDNAASQPVPDDAASQPVPDDAASQPIPQDDATNPPPVENIAQPAGNALSRQNSLIQNSEQ
jgi:hypothetical protein